MDARDRWSSSAVSEVASVPRSRVNTVIALAAALLLISALLPGMLAGNRAEAADPPIPVVFIATGQDFADALAGGPLAALSNAPILLVAHNLIPDPTKQELDRLKPQRIVIFGGNAAVSDAVAAELQQYTTGTVTRLRGANRFATAVEIAKALPASVPEADNAQTLQGQGPEAFVSSSSFGTFSEALSFGEEAVLAEAGPARFIARCSQAGSDSVVDVIATSSVGPWYASGNAEQAANAEVTMFTSNAPTGTPDYANDIDDGSILVRRQGLGAMGPSIYHLGIDGDTLGLGLGVYGHDCFVAGSYTSDQHLDTDQPATP